MSGRRASGALAAVAALTLAAASPALAAKPKAEEAAPSAERMLKIAPLSTSFRRSDGRYRMLTTELALDTPPTLRKKAEALTPRLRAAYTQALFGYAARLAGGGAPDIDALAATLQNATDKTLGERGTRVMILAIMVH